MRKTALVTGTSSGIGRDIARELAARGYDLIMVARREQRLLELQAELQSAFAIEALPLPCDLTDREQLSALFARASAWLEGRRLDVLVNNAGMGVWAEFAKQQNSTSHQNIDLNITALTILSHDFVQYARQNNTPAYILNVASLAAILPTPRYSVYSASKIYVLRLSDIMSYELRHSNISISCICPGGVPTEFMSKSGQDMKTDFGMMQSTTVAKLAVAGMFAKKRVIVPGWINKISALLRFMPRFVAMPVILKTMQSVVHNGE